MNGWMDGSRLRCLEVGGGSMRAGRPGGSNYGYLTRTLFIHWLFALLVLYVSKR